MSLNDVKENADVLKLVAEAWRNLSDRERAHWDEEARNDKVRYVWRNTFVERRNVYLLIIFSTLDLFVKSRNTREFGSSPKGEPKSIR